jgi:phage terminase small subunit
MPLPPKHQRFVDEFLVDLCATQAAIRAGYEPSCAKQQAYKLRQEPQIKREIDRAPAERSRRTGVTADRVIRELARLAFSDIRGTVEWTTSENGKPSIRLKSSRTLGDDAAAALTEVSETRNAQGTTLRVKVADKIGPLKVPAAHTGVIGVPVGPAEEDVEKLIGGDPDPEVDDRGEEA